MVLYINFHHNIELTYMYTYLDPPSSNPSDLDNQEGTSGRDGDDENSGNSTSRDSGGDNGGNNSSAGSGSESNKKTNSSEPPPAWRKGNHY